MTSMTAGTDRPTGIVVVKLGDASVMAARLNSALRHWLSFEPTQQGGGQQRSIQGQLSSLIAIKEGDILIKFPASSGSSHGFTLGSVSLRPRVDRFGSDTVAHKF